MFLVEIHGTDEKHFRKKVKEGIVVVIQQRNKPEAKVVDRDV